ncbi:hypothetical protein LIER_43383 [Lithospermum erythrorhizon]|uniref:Uncharacterized protein n=1 Tax=Lithospermum erythrorhizon TaxID=34254 RepID=A0AAV3Q0A1_LITER
MKFVLVGKFSHGRPPLNIIKEFFMGLKLQGVPLYMFEASLLSIANAIGKPLRVHPSNLNRVKLNSAQWMFSYWPSFGVV